MVLAHVVGLLLYNEAPSAQSMFVTAFMHKFLKQLLQTNRDNGTKSARTEHDYELATAVLLVEMARADNDVSDDELEAIVGVIERSFNFDNVESKALLEVAQTRADKATSLHTFTSELNDRLDKQARCKIIEHLWRVAFADGQLDRYEDHFVRKISDLLYLKHSEFMQAKHKVQAQLGLS